ncbi:MAG TPA: M20/M25/M40 family metallo-hydrolase [Longilinea sp.]|nr:M20/M25/M40 family metallo-hydrolase [Longilinea sp.]
MTLELEKHLKEMICLPGLSANEAPIRDVISAAWRPLVDELSTSRLGSLHGLRRGSGSEPRPRILLAAHMDAIGLMVTTIDGGFLHFTEVGGLDPRILPCQRVTVHGRKDIPALIVQPADRLLPASMKGNPPPMDRLLVDTGLPAAEVEKLVRPGDLISFAQAPLNLTGGMLAGHTMDNRASVAAVTQCLAELQTRKHGCDVWAAATVQEEETLGGGFTSPFSIQPDLAIAIDVTFGKGPGAGDYRTHALGKGPTIGWGPNVHPAFHKKMKSVAEELDIPFQVEIMPRHSGTDAYAMQVVGAGYPTLVLGIPLRYMHTPVETVLLKDIARTGRLMAEFITRLEPDFHKTMRWDVES